MTLIATREELARWSGRHDLVTDFAGGDYTDSGNGVSTKLINAGQKVLDRKALHIKRYSWHHEDVDAGAYSLNIRYCSSIKEVWAMNATTDRYPLDKVDLRWLREEYGEVYSELSQSDPSYYAPLVMSLAPDQAALTSSNYTGTFTYDHEEILFSDEAAHFLYSGILWMPPVDETFTISILGRFWSKPLSSDTDTSFWTEVHEELLVWAALYVLEGNYRNREGQRDYMQMIVDALADLDRDLVEEEAQDLDTMGG